MCDLLLTRTNTFQVRDGLAFEAEMEPYDVEVVGHGSTFELYGLQTEEAARWPAPDDEPSDSFYRLVASHLAPSSIAIFTTFDIDGESQQYDVHAVAVNAAGASVRIDMDDLADVAAQLLPPAPPA